MSAAGVLTRRLRVVLLDAFVLGALLLGMAAMHSSMAGGHPGVSSADASVSDAMTMTTSSAMSAPTATGASADHAMSDMNLLDCLVLGMLCFLSAIAVVILTLLLGHDHQQLRPRATATAFLHAVRGLSPPRPPSLLVLSISRT